MKLAQFSLKSFVNIEVILGKKVFLKKIENK